VDKLIDKDFIKIEQPADIYQRTSTVYRVYAYKTVLERHLLRDRTHVAKIGPGFSYVQPLSEQIAPSAVGRASLTTVANSLMSPVEQLPESTVDKYGAPRVAPHATSSVGRNNVSTVAHGTTNLDKKDLGHQTTPPSKEELAELREELRQFGPIDNAALIHLISECRGRAGDCTIDEIAYFSRQKGKLARSNPIGLILFAVPPLFEVDEHLKIREEVRRQKEVKEQEQVREQRERDEQRRSFQAIINDPTAPEGDKQLAREMMRLLD
jgi:hypothetical protein